MGFDLMGKRGSFSTNRAGWRYIFNLAIENGWEPAGTEPPDVKSLYGVDASADDWCGSYFYNDLQLVTKEDATNMANAVELSLDFQTTEYDGLLREFIDFSQSGDFVIT